MSVYLLVKIQNGRIEICGVYETLETVKEYVGKSEGLVSSQLIKICVMP